MRKVKFIIVILTIVCNVFAQEQVVNQIEVLSITQIEEKAKADANADYWGNNRPIIWVCGSTLFGCAGVIGFEFVVFQKHPSLIFPGLIIIGLSPVLFAEKIPTRFPESRENDILNYHMKHRDTYRSTYQKSIRRKRTTNSIVGLAIPVILYLIIPRGSD